MGPTALFDKSFIQSLTVDESVWFDHFFFPIICPLLYVEILADLEKAVPQGRSPGQEVGIIAQKIPEMNAAPIFHHSRRALANLMGNDVPMDGRVPLAEGKLVEVEGQRAIIYKDLPEAEAFIRWQNGEFLEVERQFARNWRTALNALDLTTVAAGIRAMGIDPQTCKSLEEAKQTADSFVSDKSRALDRMKLALIILGIPPQSVGPVTKIWESHGCPSLLDYAPYAAFLLSVEIFFQIALGANLIGARPTSNRIDVAYLFYLPFCKVFVSWDKLHRRCVPLFLRANQTFVWGPDLKSDLQRLNDHYSGLPESEKAKGIIKFAPRPPDGQEWLVSQLWDRHLRPWRGEPGQPRTIEPAVEKALTKLVKRFKDARPVPSNQTDVDQGGVAAVGIETRIHRKKGSWYQVPKDLQDADGSRD